MQKKYKNIPKCCGKEMKVTSELGRFIEVQCEKCGDVIYLKKAEFQKPKLIDD